MTVTGTVCEKIQKWRTKVKIPKSNRDRRRYASEYWYCDCWVYGTISWVLSFGKLVRQVINNYKTGSM